MKSKTHTEYKRNWLGQITETITWEEEVLVQEVCHHFWKYNKERNKRKCSKCPLVQFFAGSKLQTVANIQGYPSYDYVPVWINFDGKFQEKK